MNTVIVRRDGRGGEVTIAFAAPSLQAAVMSVMMVMVVMTVRCAGIMNTIVCASDRQFHENIHFACHTHHRPTTRSVVLEDGTSSNGVPTQTSERS